MGKHRRWIQISIFAFVLLIVGYTVAGSLFKGEERPPEAGDPVAPFELEALGGGMVGTETYKGRPMVVNFWGTFCPPCVEETPALQRMYEKYEDQGVVILGVNLGEKPAVRIEQFVDRFGVTYPVLLDPDLDVRDRYGVRSYPTTFFVDASGVVREVKVGGMTEGYIEAGIRRLLQQ
ncbi:redoxin domain-containing protein [Paenibacillus antri]|uniref:Redoxin domain-containing protein n=1 Tax=Paenibacillus antri TaxID=2582848 RepID=A0A5R9GMA6_9BACL|nr:redoxin domain-containing protein [Paenibacillus antri]TLS53055.1 redoxin domain-containing protein [Paenibacillus antri]